MNVNGWQNRLCVNMLFGFHPVVCWTWSPPLCSHRGQCWNAPQDRRLLIVCRALNSFHWRAVILDFYLSMYRVIQTKPGVWMSGFCNTLWQLLFQELFLNTVTITCTLKFIIFFIVFYYLFFIMCFLILKLDDGTEIDCVPPALARPCQHPSRPPIHTPTNSRPYT